MKTFNPKIVLALCMKLELAEASTYALREQIKLRPLTGASFRFMPDTYWRTVYYAIGKKNRHLCPPILYHYTTMARRHTFQELGVHGIIVSAKNGRTLPSKKLQKIFKPFSELKGYLICERRKEAAFLQNRETNMAVVN